MSCHSATPMGSLNLASESRRLLQHHAEYVSNVQMSKSSKRENARKYSNKIYHIQKKEDVSYRNISMTWTKSKFPKLNIANGRNKVYGSGTVLSHYHYRFDPRIGHGKCAMRRIPCLCKHCLDTLDKKWISGECAEDQPCYAPVLNCKYNQILGHYNNWIIMEFEVSENTNDDDIEDIHKSILTSIADAMGMLIKESTYGAVNAND